jgi:hypothetical protein
MDRLSRVLAVGSMAMVLGAIFTASGCRSMRSEVPPGKPYSTTGGQPKDLGFSSDPHPNTGVGPGMYGRGGLTPGATSPDGNQSIAPSNGMLPQLGTPAPNPGNYAAPTDNKYGAVGSAGTGP